MEDIEIARNTQLEKITKIAEEMPSEGLNLIIDVKPYFAINIEKTTIQYSSQLSEVKIGEIVAWIEEAYKYTPKLSIETKIGIFDRTTDMGDVLFFKNKDGSRTQEWKDLLKPSRKELQRFEMYIDLSRISNPIEETECLTIESHSKFSVEYSPEIIQPLAELTEQIYNDLFDDNWASIFKSKYLPIAKNFDSTNNIQSLIREVNNAKLLSWSEFFKRECIDEVVKRIPGWIDKSNKQNGVKTIGSIRSIATDDISNFIKEKFLMPRQRLAEKMLEWLFYNSGYTATTTLNMIGHFDLVELGKYIGDMISKLIVQVKDSFKLTNNKSHLANSRNFKPIRFSAVWHSSLHKNASQTRWLLDDLNILSGNPINKNWLKYRSYLMFDYFMKKKGEFEMGEPIFSKTWQINFYPMYKLSHDNWLSTRMHRIYKQYAPGYERDWLEFYRPMVSLWRTLAGRENFETMPYDGTEYLTEPNDAKDALIVYTNIKNFINGVDSWDKIKLY